MRLKQFLVFGSWLAAGCAPQADDTLVSRADPAPANDGGRDTAPDASKKDAGRDAGQAARTSPRVDAATEAPCESHSVRSTPTIPEMLIVLDRSGSMNPDGNDRGTDRWSGSVQAIIDVTSGFDTRIDFGLMTFPEFEPDLDLFEDAECAPGTVNVQLGAGTSAAIANVLNAMDADGRTPTAPSLEAALELLDQPQAADGVAARPRYVLLVTDGDPNCGGGGGNSTDTIARRQTIAAIEALAAADIKTFVVGYQTSGSTFAQQLDAMAAAGGTGETAHRSVESGADLSAAFEQVASRVISCSQQLENPVLDPSYVLVDVNGTPRAFGDQTDGWTLSADDLTITLTGAACDALQGGATFEVEVQCAPVQVL